MVIFTFTANTIDFFVYDFVYLSFHFVIPEIWYNKHRYNKDFYENSGITKMYNHTMRKTSGITKNSITNVFEILAGITKNWEKIVKKV